MIYPLLTTPEIYKKHGGQKVRVFIADSNGRWTAQDCSGKTLFNANYLTLANVTTYVDEAKRLQCVKHVRLTHAYVVGTIGPIEEGFQYRQIDYDPHRRDCFFWVDNDEEFTRADFAYCGERHVFCS